MFSNIDIYFFISLKVINCAFERFMQGMICGEVRILRRQIYARGRYLERIYFFNSIFFKKLKVYSITILTDLSSRKSFAVLQEKQT